MVGCVRWDEALAFMPVGVRAIVCSLARRTGRLRDVVEPSLATLQPIDIRRRVRDEPVLVACLRAGDEVVFTQVVRAWS
jgi:hypothetical protein